MAMGRPKSLDDQKQREVCALVSAGMSLPKVAMYVGCSVKTIRRLRDCEPDFDERMRRAQLAADLNPLEAMRRASGTHWRAAAWMLDRQERRGQSGKDKRRDGEFLRAVTDAHAKARQLVQREVICPLTQDRLQPGLDLLFATLAGEAAGGTSVPMPGAEGTKVAAESTTQDAPDTAIQA